MSGELTEAQAKAALARCTDEERELLRVLVKSEHPSQAVRLLELKAVFPGAQLVDSIIPEGVELIQIGGTAHTFDARLAQEVTDEAVARVDRNAPDEWKEQALLAVEQVCRTKPIFTPDDVWATGLGKPPTPQALGPVMQNARRRGWCIPTGEFVKSTMPTQHQNPIREWKSLLVPEEDTLL